MKTIHIYSVAYNRPDFITLQHQSILKHFVPANKTFRVKFRVMINAKDQLMKEQLVGACLEAGIDHIIVPHNLNELYNGGLTAYNFIRDNYFGFAGQEDYSVIMDSDMFFYNYMDIEKVSEGKDVCAIYHQRQKKLLGFVKYKYEYLWVGFMIFSHRKFQWNTIKFEPIKNICDVGGMTHYFLNENRNKGLKIKWLLHTADITYEFKKIFPRVLWDIYQPNMGVQIIEDAVIHYYRGTNWDGSKQDYIDKKDKFLKAFLEMYQGKPVGLEISPIYNLAAYTRKNFNGQVNNLNQEAVPSV